MHSVFNITRMTHENVKNGHFAHLNSRQILHEFGSGGKSGAKKSPESTSGLGLIFGVCQSISTI